MLAPGDKVTIKYRDATGEVSESGWTVLEYDDGLVKLHRPAITYRSGNEPAGSSHQIPAATKVVNMRCLHFLSADLEA
jgi:hypothetical protein